MSTSLLFPNDNTPGYIVELMYHMKVRDVMSSRLLTGKKDTNLAEIQDLMRKHLVSGIPIVEGKRLVGIVSMDDIVKALLEGKINAPASAHMTRSVVVLEDEMPVSFAISRMEKYHFGRFPVLNKNGDLVGIVTSRDILIHLLLAMNREIEEMEKRMYDSINKGRQEEGGTSVLEDDTLTQEASPGTSEGSLVHEYRTRKFDFENAGKGSTEIKKMLVDRGIDPRLARRVAVAAYELEMNQVCHSNGGFIRFEFGSKRIELLAIDRGPGIPDIEAAMTEGWSTATQWVRSLGFGAGMGLPNTRRVSDEFNIQSGPEGTRIGAGFRIEAEEPENDAED